jgi:hypothetical protein
MCVIRPVLVCLVHFIQSLLCASSLFALPSSLISHLSSLISRLSSLISHLSSLISHLSSLISHLSSLISHLSSDEGETSGDEYFHHQHHLLFKTVITSFKSLLSSHEPSHHSTTLPLHTTPPHHHSTLPLSSRSTHKVNSYAFDSTQLN